MLGCRSSQRQISCLDVGGTFNNTFRLPRRTLVRNTYLSELSDLNFNETIPGKFAPLQKSWELFYCRVVIIGNFLHKNQEIQLKANPLYTKNINTLTNLKKSREKIDYACWL